LTQAALGNKDIPYLQCHGDCDPVVPYKWGQATSTLLKQFLKNTEFKTYRGMMHGSSDEVKYFLVTVSFTSLQCGILQEMRDLKKFIEANLPPV
jgi:lysophospholipase II